MKNAKIEEYIKALENEPNSPNYDSLFSDMLELDSRVRSMSKKYGKPIDEIWNAMDIDPNTFFAEYTEDKAKGKTDKEVYENLMKLHKDALFHYTDVMEQLDDVEKIFVSAENNKYGGIAPKYTKTTALGRAMMVLGIDPKNFLGGRGIPDIGVPAHKGAYPVKKAFDVIDYIIEHKKAISVGLLALLGLYVSTAAVNANKKDGSDDTDANIKQAENQILSAGAGLEGLNLLNDGNASAVTATPAFDYYDEEFKIGINIQDGIEGNVTNILTTLKDRAPKRYAEVIPYATKNIEMTETTPNYYWAYGDTIALTKMTIEWGGSDDPKNQLGAAETLYGELIASMTDKTHVKYKDNYEAELDIHSKRGEFRIDVGLSTKEEINDWLERGGWFKAITGRYPTAEDMEGVDINKYLIK